MNDAFLDSLFNEEEILYTKINPWLQELIDIQKLIVRRGGVPKHPIKSGDNKDDTLEFSSFMNSLDTEVLKNLSHKIFHGIMGEEEVYSKDWTWDKKGEYAFKRLGKCTPKQLIDFVCQSDGAIKNKGYREKASGNLYNVVSKFNKAGKLIRHDEENGVKYELKKETLLIGNNP
jgi:hypothetical protein